MGLRFLINGELKDRDIIAALKQAAIDYEDGAILEVRDTLAEIVEAIDEFDDASCS